MTILVSTPTATHGGWLRQRPILLYLLLALGLGTAGLLVVRLGPPVVVASRLPTTIMKFSPSLAGLFVAWVVGGRSALKRLIRTLKPTRRHLRWYAVALLLPTLLYIVALHGAHRGVPPVGTIDLREFGRAFGPLFLIRLFAGGGLGEEIGWRGFMLPALARRYSLVVAALLVGVAHGLWHAPSGVGNAIALTTLTTPWAVVFAWLYYASGRSVLVCAVAHAAGNAWGPVIAAAFPDAATSFLVWVVALSWLGAVPAGLWLSKRTHEETDESH